MVTRKEMDRLLTQEPSGYTSEVVLGASHRSGHPIANVYLRHANGDKVLLAFDDPILLRDIAGDLYAAAQYLEDESYKNLTERRFDY
jgi:hypothetical protein